MRLIVLQDERFTCSACGGCCRQWLPELMPGEEQSVEALIWPAGDPLVNQKKILRHGGKSYLARRSDGACLFLNESNGLCRIHEHFGVDAKPLGCRMFPFQLAPTFKGEATVSARYDCPTVRKNIGASHAEALPELRRLSSRFSVPAGFDESTCCNLEKDQITAVCEFIATLMNGFATDDQRAQFILYLCDVLETTQPNEISRKNLASIFPGLKSLVENSAAMPVRRPGWFQRMAFRALLGLYIRRDEDVLNQLAGRFGRVRALIAVILGFGSFRALGLSHPAGTLRNAKLFRPTTQPHDPKSFALFWRLVRNRLDSLQFMGPANHGRNFITGLRSLALLYPLTFAAAKFSAANRNAACIEAEDVDYAVTVIEHSYGRLPVLNQKAIYSIEILLLNSKAFHRLIKSI